jgi:hypothetical protein
LIELEPRYVDATVNRWEALTGRRAERESIGLETVLRESTPADRPAQSMREEGSVSLSDALDFRLGAAT